ncbi:MAG: NEW3 domain-containing protein [Acidobacteriota bacterium]
MDLFCWNWRSSVLLVAMLALSVSSYAQLTASGDDQTRFLEVRRRQIELKEQRAEFERVQRLASEGLISAAELHKAQVSVDVAQLNYQEAVLALLTLQPRISIRRAVKIQTPDGRRFVDLTVANLTPTFDDSQFRLLNNFEGADPIPPELRRRDVRDIFISLRDVGEDPGTTRGTTIALPYETHLDELPYGQTKQLRFQLLKDVSSVTVSTTYKGRTQEFDVQLEQAETATAVNLASNQISLEADLGSAAVFSLRLERSTVDQRTFQLKLVNLPHQISYSFLDPSTQARLSQISFSPGISQQQLELRLFLPERAGDSVPIDSPIQFWALVMSPDQSGRFDESRTYGATEIEVSRVGNIRLEVIPRGVGRIEVAANSLFSEIQVGQRVDASLTVRNTGTRRLDNIKLRAEYPLNWNVEINPDIIPALDINQEQAIHMILSPPSDVPVGDYEVRLRTECSAYNRPVPTEDKVYRVSVKARPNLLGTLGLVGGLVLLVIAVVIFGIRLARR